MKLKIGDVFEIAIDENRDGFGQIVALPNESTLLISIFERVKLKTDTLSLDEICNSRILFLGFTLDAKLYHKHWRLIGNYNQNIGAVKIPYYRLGTPPDEIYIINYKEEVIRACSIEEFDKLKYITVIAPVRYEKALKAFYKVGEWSEDYDKLTYEPNNVVGFNI